MALKAVVFSQDLLGCTVRELYNMGGAAWCHAFGGEVEEKGVVLECEIGSGGGQAGKVTEQGSQVVVDGMHGNLDTSNWGPSSSPPETAAKDCAAIVGSHEAPAVGRKRRRTRIFKNQEEVENQRMTHIAVERNRRKQMNEYLAVLQSLMPASYVQRGDQASIIGGAINFVKELEQLVQSLEARKLIEQRTDAAPFADFFTFPQYSTSSSRSSNRAGASDKADEGVPENRPPALADIEVTTVESHANLKLLSRRRPKQLLKMMLGLQNLGLTTLHLNVTSIAEMAFYSFSLKVEDDCQLTSVDDIATAVHQMVGAIQKKADCDTIL